jgi:biopolymer transport protein TolQ
MYFLLAFVSVTELLNPSRPVPMAVLLLLVACSVISWTIVFARWKTLKANETADGRFLRGFRKTPGFEALNLARAQFGQTAIGSVYDAGFQEVDRQVKSHGALRNSSAVERSLQIAVSGEVDRLETSLNWLATIATVTPFIGLFGTVWGIIDAFEQLSTSATVSLRTVGPGIAEALIATGMGLLAAIPAAVFYNYFGHQTRRVAARLEDFTLEFLNFTERQFGG